MAFASVEDLAAYTGRAVENTAQAQLALTLATGIIRAEVGQTLSLVEDDRVTLRAGSRPELYLPERPVVAVSSVAGDGIRVGEWTWAGEYVTRPYGWPNLVTITYSHGYAVIPDDVRAICLSVAGRVLAQNDPDGPQVAQETVGSYSVQYVPRDAGSATSALLSEGERELLRRTYRRSAGMVSMR